MFLKGIWHELNLFATKMF